MVQDIVEIVERLDRWITRCEGKEEASVREEIASFLASDAAVVLPHSADIALRRAVTATDRVLTALAVLAALDSVTIPRRAAGRVG